MNIGIDLRAITHPTVSGVTTYVHEVVRALIAMDRENEYFLWWNSRRDDVAPSTFAQSNVHLVTTRKRNTFLNLRLALTDGPPLDRLILKSAGRPDLRLDIIWLPDPRPVRVSPDCHLVTTIHDRASERFPHFFSMKTCVWHRLLNTRAIAERSDHLLTPSVATANEIAHAWDIEPARITATPLGVHASKPVTEIEIAAVRAKYHIPERFVLTLSTLEPRKNLLTLIRAFDRLKTETDLPHALVLAGSFDQKTFADPRLPHADWLHFTGFVAEEDKSVLIAAADAFVFPSVYEGFGLPILEAMSVGAPVVCSDIPAHREVAGGVATYVPTGNIEAWDFAMRKSLAMSEAERRSKAAAGRARAKTFDWRETAKKTLEAFERAAKR